MSHFHWRKLYSGQLFRGLGMAGRFSGFRICLACVASVLVSENQAYAYADPGSGALLWQALLAGFFSVLFYARRIKAWLQSGRKDKENIE